MIGRTTTTPRRVLLAGAALLGLAAAHAAGPAPAAAGEGVTVPLVVKDTTSPFWQTVMAGGCAAAKETGANVPLLGATSEADIAGQIAALENAVAGRPAAVVLASTSFDALGPAVDEAASKVPVVGIDSLADSKKFSSFLTTDNVEGGRMAARALGEAIAKKFGKAEGEVAIVSFIPGPSSLRDRMAGFTEVIKGQYPGLKIVTTRIGDGQTTTNLNQTIDMMSAFPNLRGIFADAVFSGLGAGQAVAESNAKDRIMVVSFDSSDQLVKWVEEGVVQALVVQDPFRMGNEGVKIALMVAKGENVSAMIDTGANLITKENMGGQRAQQLLKPDLSCLSK